MDDDASQESILIVDDTPANLHLLRQAMSARGYNVTVASTGQQALTIAAEIQPQLILVDTLLPDKDVYEVCRHLKNDPRLHEIPVIILYASPETVDKVKGFQVGAVDYLTKPFQFDEVLARVEVHLSLYRQKKQIEQLLAQRELAEAAERQQYRVVNTLLRSAVALSSTLLLDKVLDHMLQAVEEIVPNDLAMVILVEQDIASVARVQGHLPDNWRSSTASFPIKGLRIVETMLESRHPYVIADTWNEPLCSALPDQPSLRSFIGAPIFTDDQLIGILGLMALPVDFYTEAMTQHLEALAALAAFAIKNARLYEQARELAVVQERQRLARDLHDSVSQTLFSANALAEVLPRIIDRDGDRARQYMIELAKFTRTAMAEMRSLLFELRPESFKGTDLGILLKQLCDLFSLQTGMTIELQLSDEIVLAETEQMIFYRVAQETLTNIARHANATRVAVSLRRQPDGVELRIYDNGCGFDRQDIPAGNGIKRMLERANSIGASLVINSESGRGTEIMLKGIT